MHVASLENSKKLYELSGWDTLVKWVVKDNGLGDLTTGVIHFSHREYTEVVGTADESCPAYDLGYLLRKLPGFVDMAHKEGFEWRIAHEESSGIYADTPEDAACKLAIELFNQGVLQKEGQS